jgi:hypothetical protein
MNAIKSLLGLQAGLLSVPAAIDALEDSESREQIMMVLEVRVQGPSRGAYRRASLGIVPP